MKKLIILIAIAVVLLGAPNFVGSSAEAHIDKMLAQYNSNPSIKVTKTDYNKGWFSSTATYEIEIIVPMDPSLPKIPSIKVEQQLFHGPILWKHDGLSFGLLDAIEVIQLPEEFKEIQDALTISSRVAFDGSTDARINLDAIEFEQEGVTINISPAIGSFNFTKAGKIVSNFDWQGMTVVQAGSSIVEMGALQFNLDTTLLKGEMFSPTAIFVGTFDTSLKSFNMLSPIPGMAANFSDLSITSNTTAEDDVLNLTMAFKIAEMEVANQNFTDFVYELSFENLDIDGLQDFAKIMSEMPQDMQTSPEASLAMVTDSLIAVLPKLLATEPKLIINNLGLTTTEGDIKTTMDVTIDVEKYNADDIASLVPAVVLNASGNAPLAYFATLGLGPMIDTFVQQNMLVSDGTSISFEFQMIDGKTILNGVALPLF